MSSSSYPPHELYPMPALSPTMETGTIAKWNLGPGDSFSAGDVLCEIETDKATVDFEAQDDGVIAKILREGSTASELSVGEPICVIVDDEKDVAAFSDFTVDESSSSGSMETNSNESGNAKVTEETNSSSMTPTLLPSAAGPSGTSILMPGARFLSQSKGVDATVLEGTGKGGRVTKADVMEALENNVDMPAFTMVSPSASAASVADAKTTTIKAAESTAMSTTPVTLNAPPPLKLDDIIIPTISTSGEFEDVKNNTMRKVIAKRLTESKSGVPHFYTSMEIELDNIMDLRKKLISKLDVKVSVNDLIIRGCALALRDVPEVNASYSTATKHVSMSPSIDISVAVATPGGLITPIVPNTDKLGLLDISDKVKDLAGRARNGKLLPEEFQGGSFCISNLGMFGINEFSAVINPPQAAILAVGGGVKKVVVPSLYDETKSLDDQPQPTIKNVMTARLSADRRVVDEPTAGLFLNILNKYLSKPELLVL